jgi:hypothetical protein
MPDTSPAAGPTGGRDPRLDVFRGIALVMIFINHVPGNVFERLTSRNFGFSDAAEGFVMMSGIAAGLAYSGGFRPRATWAGARRLWNRVWTLYMVHLLVTAWALAVTAASAKWFGEAGLLFENQVNTLFKDPLGVLIGIPLLLHQFGYANILPLYAVLLAATPLFFIIGLRRPWLLLALAAVLWALAGQFRLNLPNYPNPGGWFFNPLSWQLIFVVGLMTGAAMKQGRRLVPVRRGLQILSGGYLLFTLVWMWVPGVAPVLNHTMWLMSQAGLPFYITAFDKTFLTAPRLLHILALTYFLSSLPWVRQAAASAAAEPFALLGRNALPVFALGTVLCFALQAVSHATESGLLLDSVMIVGGLAVQYALAHQLERFKPARR